MPESKNKAKWQFEALVAGGVPNVILTIYQNNKSRIEFSSGPEDITREDVRSLSAVFM